MQYNDWFGPIGWGGSRPIPQPKGNYANGGKPSTMRTDLRVDPGGKAFGDIDRALELNGRSVAKTMHLLSEFPSYCDWETEDQRCAMMLYNRPVSLGIGYSVNNLNGNKTSRVGGESAGFLKHKLKSKIDENEEAIKKAKWCEPIKYVRMFKILRGKYKEPGGSHIIRIAKQLSEMEGVIFHEL